MVSNGKGQLTDAGRVFKGTFANGKPIGEVEVISTKDKTSRKALFKDGIFNKWLEDEPKKMAPGKNGKAGDKAGKSSKFCLFC